jgi:hypothetical protein
MIYFGKLIRVQFKIEIYRTGNRMCKKLRAVLNADSYPKSFVYVLHSVSDSLDDFMYMICTQNVLIFDSLSYTRNTRNRTQTR